MVNIQVTLVVFPATQTNSTCTYSYIYQHTQHPNIHNLGYGGATNSEATCPCFKAFPDIRTSSTLHTTVTIRLRTIRFYKATSIYSSPIFEEMAVCSLMEVCPLAIECTGEAVKCASCVCGCVWVCGCVGVWCVCVCCVRVCVWVCGCVLTFDVESTAEVLPSLQSHFVPQ